MTMQMNALKRHPFPVPEWCRTIWTSEDARAIWAPRLTRINQAWEAAERASVGTFRAACRQSISSELLPELSEKATAAGLSLTILGRHGVGSYQAGPKPTVAGQPWAYQVVLAAGQAHGRAFVAAHRANDDRAIGELLGFPPCCIDFFERVWKEERWIDTTWPMAGVDEPTRAFTNVPAENNILLRWLGVRLVPHLPCSFGCAGTYALGSLFNALMKESFPEEHGWATELLTSNVEWSELKGIAEIKLPILKVSAKSDATAEKLTVRLMGHDRLEGASRGNVFPYLPAKRVAPLTFFRADHKDNGFTSQAAQDAAHATMKMFYDTYAALPPDAKIVDLGCGNGALVGSLSTNAEGVESDRSRASSAKVKVYAMTIEEFVEQNDEQYDLAFFMPGRLDEATERGRMLIKRWLKEHACQTIVYVYGDWAKSEGLEGLLNRHDLSYGTNPFMAVDNVLQVALL